MWRRVLTFSAAAAVAIGLGAQSISVNDAGTWREIQEVYVNDAGTWREIQEVYVNDAGTWRLVFEAVSYQLAGGMYDWTTNTGLGVPDASAVTIFVNTNGTETLQTTGGGSLLGNWVDPTSAASSNHWVRWTNTSGAVNVGSGAGVWHQLTANRSFGITYTGLTGSASVQGTLEIAIDSGGSTVVASASYTLTAAVQEF